MLAAPISKVASSPSLSSTPPSVTSLLHHPRHRDDRRLPAQQLLDRAAGSASGPATSRLALLRVASPGRPCCSRASRSRCRGRRAGAGSRCRGSRCARGARRRSRRAAAQLSMSSRGRALALVERAAGSSRRCAARCLAHLLELGRRHARAALVRPDDAVLQLEEEAADPRAAARAGAGTRCTAAESRRRSRTRTRRARTKLVDQRARVARDRRRELLHLAAREVRIEDLAVARLRRRIDLLRDHRALGAELHLRFHLGGEDLGMAQRPQSRPRSARPPASPRERPCVRPGSVNAALRRLAADSAANSSWNRLIRSLVDHSAMAPCSSAVPGASVARSCACDVSSLADLIRVRSGEAARKLFRAAARSPRSLRRAPSEQRAGSEPRVQVAHARVTAQRDARPVAPRRGRARAPGTPSSAWKLRQRRRSRAARSPRRDRSANPMQISVTAGWAMRRCRGARRPAGGRRSSRARRSPSPSRSAAAASSRPSSIQAGCSVGEPSAPADPARPGPATRP